LPCDKKQILEVLLSVYFYQNKEPGMFCPECGAQNQADAQFCKQCGHALPGLNLVDPRPAFLPVNPVQPADEVSPLLSWWQRLAPDWKSALVMSVFLVSLGFVSDAIPGLGFLFTLPFTILLYYIQGVLVGRYSHRNTAYRRKNFFWLGMKSGLWTSLVIGSIFTLITLAIQYTLTLGAALALIPLVIAQTLFEIIMNVTFSGLGAWLYGLFGGARLIGVSAGIVGCGTLMAVGLALVLVIVLALVGVQIFKDLSHNLHTFLIMPGALALLLLH
jgi:hypothetical protein